MKDLFSTQSGLYAQHRPVYPPELYGFVMGRVKRRDAAWDCATGNGQVARVLAEHFGTVAATDISQNQLTYAAQSDHITYVLSSAERTPFSDNSFNLITAAQAFHWFDSAAFCREATRVSRPGGTVAVWGYDLATVDPAIDPILRHWNFDLLSPYWAEERKHIYTHYKDLTFEFDQVEAREFTIVVMWDVDDLIGHLRTWSALRTMIAQVGDEPFLMVLDELRKAWGNGGQRRCVFPVFLKLGKVTK